MQPSAGLSWIRQCSQCRDFDADDLQEQIAAAEQRGAVMVMDTLKREASDSNWEGLVQPGRSLQELVDHIKHGIRADQEGDDD